MFFQNGMNYSSSRVVEMDIFYRLEGIEICESDSVSLTEFSEVPVTYSKMKNSAFEPFLSIYVGCESDHMFQQECQWLESSLPPSEVSCRDLDHNQVGYWDLSSLVRDGLQEFELKRRVRMLLSETESIFDLQDVIEYNTRDPYYLYYTRSQQYMEQTPDICAFARKIAGSLSHPYDRARALYDWCMKNISYLYPGNRGIQYCLPRGTGDCGSYSIIYATLCRSIGIPARIVNGQWCCRNKQNYHVWNEIYFENIGWIPVDVTNGRILLDNPGATGGSSDPYYYFGNMDSGRFISSIGSSVQLYPVPPWHNWGLDDCNRTPIFFQRAATISSNLKIAKQYATVELVCGNDLLW